MTERAPAASDPSSRQAQVYRAGAASLWRNRDYMILWGGQLVSSVGSMVSELAFPLLILAVTHSPAAAGFATALRFGPYLLLMLPAGALIDRWNRKRVMICCDVGRALALGSIPLAATTGHLTLPLVFAAALVEGTLYVFFSLGEMAAIPQVVPPPQLAAASSQSQAASSVSQILGPALGGLLFSLGAGLPFFLDAVSYACSVGSLVLIRSRFEVVHSTHAALSARQLWREVRDGGRWLWQQHALRSLALLTGGLMACSAGYPLIVIVVAQRMHASSAAIGLVLAAGGLGGIVGALVAGPLLYRLPLGPLVVGLIWALALTWPPYAFAPNLWVLAGILAVTFVVVPPYFAAQFSYRMRVIPDALQGRVSSIYRLLAFGIGQPVGLIAAGALLQAFGPVRTVLILFVPQVALALAATADRGLRAARL